jgi:hypothetical protein
MRDGQAQPARRLQNPGHLRHRPWHVVDVMQAHVGDHQVKGTAGKRQPGGVTRHDQAPLPRRQADHRRRRVDPDHPVAPRPEHPADPPLAAGQIQRALPRWRQQVQQHGQVEDLVRPVVPRRARVRRPVPRLVLPPLPQPHPGRLSQNARLRVAGGGRHHGHMISSWKGFNALAR